MLEIEAGETLEVGYFVYINSDGKAVTAGGDPLGVTTRVIAIGEKVDLDTDIITRGHITYTGRIPDVYLPIHRSNPITRLLNKIRSILKR